MADLASYVAASIVLVAAVAKFLSIRPSRPSPAQRHLLVALAAFGPAHALAVPATQAATARIDPWPFATNLLSHSLAMVAGNSLVLMLAHTLDDPVSVLIRARRRTATGVLIGAVLVMSVLLVLSDVEFSHGDFASVSARHGTLAAYQVVFLGFMAFCAGRFIVLLRRYLSRPDVEPVMRWGMRGVILGASVGLGWLGWSALTMIMARAGGQLVSRPAVVAEVIGALSVTLMALGSTLSVYGAWLPTSRRRRVGSALRDLTPLWRLVSGVLPAIKFGAIRADPEVVLYRRVIEIRDAQVTLTRHIPPDLQAEVIAAALRDVDADDRNEVRAEAAVLAVAIDAYRAGCPPTDSAAINDPSAAVPDVLAEARRLIQVCAALREDLAVARIVQHARQRLGMASPPDGVGRTVPGGIGASLMQSASLGRGPVGWPRPRRNRRRST